LLDLATRYTYIYSLGVPFLALTNYLMAIFRAKGDSKTPLVVLSLAGLLNVGLNLFFVFAVKLSVEGVAIATAAANAASFAVLIIKLRRDNDDTKFSFRKLKIDKQAFKDIVFNGVPAGIQGALFSLSNMLIQSSILTVNNNSVPSGSTYQPVINGSAAAGNLEGFVYTAMNAVYQGAITITSQNVGAKKLNRVNRILYASLLAVVSVGVIMAGIIFLLRKPLLALYSVKAVEGDEMAMMAFDTAMIRFYLILIPYFLFGIMDVCAGVLRGMGKAIVSTVISLVGICGFRVVWLLAVFPAMPTLEIIFVSYPISWVLSEIVMFTMIQILLRRMLKKQQAENAEAENQEVQAAE
jgi:Na+-driven multidrug efflux pump